MKLRILYLLILVIIGTAFYSCVKKPTYPTQPVIAYKDFIRYGKNLAVPDSIHLVISFTDNEGDIGLDQSDTLPPFNHDGNLYMVFFVLDTVGTNHWIPYDLIQNTPEIDTLKIGFRVPLVLKDGEKAQPMKGLIYAKQKAPINPTAYNTFRYDVYMYDKAKNISNRITTPAFTLN